VDEMLRFLGFVGVATVVASMGCAVSPIQSTSPGAVPVSAPAAPAAPVVPVAAEPAVRPVEFRLQVGDEVAIAVWKEPELTSTQRVGPDGTLSPLLLGTVPVVGYTVDQTRERLTTLYKEYLKTPVVSVRVVAIYSDRVFILGEVKTPSAVPLVGPTTLVQGITQAGGFLEEFANRNAIRLIRKGPDGSQQVSVIPGNQILVGMIPDVPLQRGDIVYVPARGVTNWSRTVGQALSPISSAIDTAGSVAVIYDVATR
jgi:protein involved in polysaccharide export with SLBB domain